MSLLCLFRPLFHNFTSLPILIVFIKRTSSSSVLQDFAFSSNQGRSMADYIAAIIHEKKKKKKNDLDIFGTFPTFQVLHVVIKWKVYRIVLVAIFLPLYMYILEFFVCRQKNKNNKIKIFRVKSVLICNPKGQLKLKQKSTFWWNATSCNANQITQGSSSHSLLRYFAKMYQNKVIQWDLKGRASWWVCWWHL